MKLSGFALFAGLTSSTVAQAVKVMLLGDSITEITCWRPLVWEQITSAGLAGSVDFVGSMNDLQPQCSRPQGFDPDHEGHSGWQAYDIARNNIVGWVQNTKPDIVQFMLGTNDVNIGHRNADSIIGSYTIMLNAMRAANPRVKVIVDKIIPTSWSDATIEAVNNAIPGWVLQQTTAESPVVIADCSRAAGFTNDMLRDDGVHPNSKGDQFIAGQIGPKLIQLIKDVSTGTTSSTSSTSTSSTSSTSTSGGSGTGAAHWGQCGGIGWNGPTTCVSPYTCQQINAYYYQCL